MTYKKPDADWFMKGGLEELEADSIMEEDDGNHFFYQKWYTDVWIVPLGFQAMWCLCLALLGFALLCSPLLCTVNETKRF